MSTEHCCTKVANYCTVTNDDSHSTVFSSAFKKLYILHLGLPRCLHFTFLGKHIVHVSHSPRALHHLWFDESNHIWNGAQIIYLFIMWFPLSSKYVIPHRSKEAYSPQHFWGAFALHSSIKTRDQVLQLYKTAGKMSFCLNPRLQYIQGKMTY